MRSAQYGDIYFSAQDGLAETRHVFHKSIDLPAVWAGQPNFTICETGFGTGLNFLATWQLLDNSLHTPRCLHYLSLEKHPVAIHDLARCHALFPQLERYSTSLIGSYPLPSAGFHRLWLEPGRVCLTLCYMDAEDAIEQLSANVDCWFLDGFAPSMNPAMWTDRLFRGMARLSRPGARVTTFTSAGAIRRGLEASGFLMARQPGFGRKREMLTGSLARMPAYRDRTPWFALPATDVGTRQAVVIGAGIAGAQVAWHLAIRGWRVTVVERNSRPGLEASGNPAAIVSPRVTARPSIAEQFSVQAFLYQLRQFAEFGAEACGWHQSGVLQLAHSRPKRQQWQGLRNRSLCDALVRCVDSEEASRLAGVTVDYPGLIFRDAGWVEPGALIDRLLQHRNISVIRDQQGSEVHQEKGLWQILDSAGSPLTSAPVVIVASGSSLQFEQTRSLPHTPVSGQTTYATATTDSSRLRTVLQHDGYILPAHDGNHLLGATFQRHDTSTRVTAGADSRNLAALQHHVPAVATTLGSLTGAHAAIRMTSGNRMPLIGPLVNNESLIAQYPQMRRKDFVASPASCGHYPGLFISGAFGSRGFTNAALGAELLASRIDGNPSPLQAALCHAVHPARDLINRLKRSDS